MEIQMKCTIKTISAYTSDRIREIEACMSYFDNGMPLAQHLALDNSPCDDKGLISLAALICKTLAK